MRNGKLYARYRSYRSDDGEAADAACPTFSGNVGYCVLERQALIRYQRFGTGYKRDVARRPDVQVQQLPVETCAHTKSGVRARS
ncbi:Secreted protein (fragment) [Xanthomonas citri pv. fuscans]